HVDLGLPEAAELDLTPYRARILARDGFDEAFA
ncbi:MAG: heme ABC transporter ATP-binding protein CcmA, partial [Rhodobacterales bacterium]